MIRARLVVIFSLFVLFFGITVNVNSQGSGAGSVLVDALVAGCGNAVIENGEECDGLTLQGATCYSKGFTGGSLSCTATCFYNTSACIYTPPTSGGGGVSGSSGLRNNATVVLVGKAYPMSQVVILKDGQIIAKTIASAQANFQVSVTGLAAGSYGFMIYGEDAGGLKSPLLSFPVLVSRGTITKIEDIFIAPTIALDKTEVRKGDIIKIFGQSVPLSEITLEVNSPQQFFSRTTVDKSGVYLYNFDSSVLEYGHHSTQSRSATNTEISAISSIAQFQVGAKNVFVDTPAVCSKKADLNNDCRVNLVDFSIVAFWYLRPLTPAFTQREAVHLNGDGKVNLVDFSIMAFQWTG